MRVRPAEQNCRGKIGLFWRRGSPLNRGRGRARFSNFGIYGLARLERSSSGNFGYEAGGALGTGGGYRSEDLPGSRAFLGFVTTGDLACDDRRAQLPFGQVVGRINAIVIGER